MSPISIAWRRSARLSPKLCTPSPDGHLDELLRGIHLALKKVVYAETASWLSMIR